MLLKKRIASRFGALERKQEILHVSLPCFVVPCAASRQLEDGNASIFLMFLTGPQFDLA